jgi:cell division protein FtsB
MSKVIIVLLTVISVFLQFKFWFKPDGIRGIINIERLTSQQEKQLSILQERNLKLLGIIKLLKQNPSALEEYARVNFGMIKKDEIFYRIID